MGRYREFWFEKNGSNVLPEEDPSVVNIAGGKVNFSAMKTATMAEVRRASVLDTDDAETSYSSDSHGFPLKFLLQLILGKRRCAKLRWHDLPMLDLTIGIKLLARREVLISAAQNIYELPYPVWRSLEREIHG